MRRRNTFTISHIKGVAFDEYENEYLMSPEEKIQYVKDNIDGETLISPKGPIRYHVTSVGHPDNPEEWTALTRNEHRRILQKLEQEQYIKDLTLVRNGDYYMLEKVDSFSTEKVTVDFTQKGKTSTDYLMEAVNFFKNEYNKIRIKGVTYEYPMGDNLTLSNYDPAPDDVNIDIRNYAKFILQEGDIEEKREFLRCLKSKILLINKKISLA